MSAVVTAADQTTEIVSFNPATGSEVGRVSVTPADDVVRAVEAGREAFAKWKAISFDDRSQLIMKARDVLLAEIDDIARLISDESGKPVAEALSMEIAPVLDLMQYFARNAEKMLRPAKIGIGLYGLMGRSSRVVYHPLGVVGIIPAWNFPFSIPMGEAAMALMAGNTVVIKPSELTPIVGLKIGEIFAKAQSSTNLRLSDLPLVQIVSGGGETGAALVDAAPDKIMFTGSVATGKKIAAAAAKNLTSVVLELGGKDPMIVFDDANLELAAGAAVWGAFCNAGQACSSVERLYVQESVAGELTRKIIEKTKELKQGSGENADVSIGAMSSERQIRIVEDHVEDFRAAGATIEIGGKRNADTLVRSSGMVGNADKSVRVPLFYEPTVITGATNDMRAMQEETFGPTLPIATFKTEDEAIAMANDSEFGLTASVWTGDLARGKRVAQQIEAGSVCVNEALYTHGIGQTPWGGFKNSGRGRTHGREGLMELVQPQHIHVNNLSLLPDAWWMPYSATAVGTFRKMTTTFASGSLIRTARLLPQLARRIRELMKK
jgi:acyl-CoA reductase-like NAD-dependent aldehyde dehydrogenase